MVGCFWIGPQCWPQCWARSSWEAWVCHRLTVNSLSGWTHLPFWPLDCYRNQEDSKSLCKQSESGGDDGGRGGREGIVKVGPARCLHKGNQADLIFLSDQGKVFTAQKVKRERAIG